MAAFPGVAHDPRALKDVLRLGLDRTHRERAKLVIAHGWSWFFEADTQLNTAIGFGAMAACDDPAARPGRGCDRVDPDLGQLAVMVGGEIRDVAIVPQVLTQLQELADATITRSGGCVIDGSGRAPYILALEQIGGASAAAAWSAP